MCIYLVLKECSRKPCIKMNACGCILLERSIYTCTLLACALIITHLDCLSSASLLGNSALSCIKMNACGCILLKRGIYTCTLFACALLRSFRQYIAWFSGSKKDREVAVICELPRIDFAECLRLHSFRTRYIHMYFTRLRFITHLDCLSRASLFGNPALSCIKMNVCDSILLERGIYTCTLFACDLLRCLRQYIAWFSGSKKDREVAVICELPRIDFAVTGRHGPSRIVPIRRNIQGARCLDKFTSGDRTHFRLTVSRNDFLLTGRLF